jgi:hypothetical protein
MSFWIGLVYQGARACGMRELTTCINIEHLWPSFPYDYPDSDSGKCHMDGLRIQREEQYGRYPPDKRPNFGKLRIATPFHFDWSKHLFELLKVGEEPSTKRMKFSDVLLNEDHAHGGNHTHNEGHACKGDHSHGSISFYVLRDKAILLQLTSFYNDLFNDSSHSPHPLDSAYFDIYHRHKMSDILSLHNQSILTVAVEISRHGRISSSSSLSLPTADDLNKFTMDDSFLGPIEELAPRGVTFVEEGVVHVGVYQMTRKEMKKLKVDRRKELARTRNKGNNDDCSLDFQSDLTRPPNEVFKMAAPSPSRLVIGYVNDTAGYRHTTSHYGGVGHCSLVKWVELCRVCYMGGIRGVVCLVRGHTQQYQVANVSLLTHNFSNDD